MKNKGNRASSFFSRAFLNNHGSQFTGTVHCYYGPAEWKKEIDHGFIAIGDCNVTARLHAEDQDKKKFAKKLRLLSEQASNFADWLEES